MGAGASTKKDAVGRPDASQRSERVTFSVSTLKRRQAKREQREHAYRYALLLKYDRSRTGTLSRDEVKALATDLLTQYTPQVGGLSDDEVDLIMKIGGETCNDEITRDQLPVALAIMDQIRNQNKGIVDLFSLFAKCDKCLKPKDMEALLTEKNGGVKPRPDDVRYIISQLGNADVTPADLKAALACWYCLGKDEEDGDEQQQEGP